MLCLPPTTATFFGLRNRDVQSALEFFVAAAVSAAEGRSFDRAGNEKSGSPTTEDAREILRSE